MHITFKRMHAHSHAHNLLANAHTHENENTYLNYTFSQFVAKKDNIIVGFAVWKIIKNEHE